MDPLSASCLNLHLQNDTVLKSEEDLQITNEVPLLTRSLSSYESKGLKTSLPQIFAAAMVATFHIVGGVSMSFSAILIPQLLAAQNQTDAEDVIKITQSDASWIASIMVLVTPIGGIAGGFVMDSIGRLNTIKLASLPILAGWITIALSKNLTMLITGRLLTGIVSTWGMNPSLVYVTETSSPNLRGSLVSFGALYVSLGMMLGYLEGWVLHWRWVAWSCIIYIVGPIMLISFCLHESPPWLVSKGRIEQARKSLEWLHRYNTPLADRKETYAELQLAIIQKEEMVKTERQGGNSLKQRLKLFLSPTVYKPMLILTGLFFFQQFTGIYITLFFAITFVEDVGTDINPYLASILVGGMRFIMSIVNTWLMRRFNRRTLLYASGFGMALCMAVSGLCTKWIHEGQTSLNWIPVVMLLLYVVMSMVGFLSIPWAFTAELFPLAVRGIAQSLACSIGTFLMFVAVQAYYDLDRLFGGSSGLQYFFAVMTLGGTVYCYVFVPETHKKKLTEVEEYFLSHTTYLSVSCAEKSPKTVRNVQEKV